MKQSIDKKWVYFTWMFIVAGAILLITDVSLFFNGDDNSAIYLLSAMLQSLAAILTIVVTVTFVIAQMTSRTFTSDIVEKIVRDKFFTIFLVLYIFGIGISAELLGNVEYSVNTYIPLTNTNLVGLAVYLFIACVIFLGGYVTSIIQFLKPVEVVRLCGEDIKKGSILQVSKNKETTNKSKIDINGSDPLQPLRDIANNAISGLNHEVARLAINKIGKKG